MTANDISLLSVAVSLLSALFAAWSVRETIDARKEATTHKYINRKTELSVLLSDVMIKGLQLRHLTIECLNLAKDKDIANKNDGMLRIDTVMANIDDVDSMTKEIKQLKENLLNEQPDDLQGLELLFSQFYEKMKYWENEVDLCKRVHERLKALPAPSVYEKRGLRTL